MAKQTSVIVRGQAFNANTIKGRLANFGKASHELGDAIEAAAKHATIHGNHNPVTRLFSNGSPLLKQNGDLTILGKAAKTFILFHVACVKIDKNEKGAMQCAFTAKKKQAGKFATGIDENGEKQFDSEGDFAFSFAEWQERQKGKTTTTTTKKAETFTNAIGKALDSISGDVEGVKVTGDFDDYAALAKAAQALATKAYQMAAHAETKADGVETETAAFAAGATSKRDGRADTDREAAIA